VGSGADLVTDMAPDGSGGSFPRAQETAAAKTDPSTAEGKGNGIVWLFDAGGVKQCYTGPAPGPRSAGDCDSHNIGRGDRTNMPGWQNMEMTERCRTACVLRSA